MVGSTAFYLHKLQDVKPNDIDIVVNSISGIKGDIYTYFTDSKHSTSGNRACILENGISKIDIFVEELIPPNEIIDGIRVATLHSLILYYESLYLKVAEHLKPGIYDKINTLSYGR